ncbi:MAG: multicopper oxidase domain-containing protein, partial [Bacillota bacterium]
LSSGQPFYQIGSDQGLLNEPVKLDQLTLGPGERADVILDFSKMKGQTIILRNDARTPFPAGDPVDPESVGQIMAFRVIQPLQGTDRSVIPATLRPAPIAQPTLEPSQTQPTVRQLLLFEGKDELGRIMPLLGTARDGAMQWGDPTTENPHLNDVEIWEIYNTTVDTHPIHLHLVHFQVLNRQRFTATQDPDTGALTNIRLMGSLSRPQANEAGLKDTVQMPPGQVTRIIAKFDREGEYVWHCHILSHEDHEMMRRIEVLPERVPTSADSANVAAPAAPATVFSTKPITAGLPMREDPLPTPAAPVS